MEIFETIMIRVSNMLVFSALPMAAFAITASRYRDAIFAGLAWAGAAISMSVALGIRIGLMM